MKTRIYGIKDAETKEMVNEMIVNNCELEDVSAKAEYSKKGNLTKVLVYGKGSKALNMVIHFLPIAKIEFYHRNQIVKTI